MYLFSGISSEDQGTCCRTSGNSSIPTTMSPQACLSISRPIHAQNVHLIGWIVLVRMVRVEALVVFFLALVQQRHFCEMARHSRHDHDHEIHSEVADITKKWLRDHCGSFVKKALQQYNTDLVNDIQFASAFQLKEVWGAIKKLRQLADEKPREQQLPTGPSVRSLSDTVLEEVSACTKLIGDLEQRLAGAERVLRRTEEAGESHVLELQKHDEDVAERVTELQEHRDPAWLRHMEEQETMRQIIANDLILLGSGGVKKKEDLGSHRWAKVGSKSQTSIEKADTSAIPSKEVSTENSSESDSPELITTARTMDAIRFSDGGSHKLQLSVWDAVLFLGLKNSHRHEQLLLGLGFVINVIMQSVFSLMVLNLGTDSRSWMTPRWRVWRPGSSELTPGRSEVSVELLVPTRCPPASHR